MTVSTHIKDFGSPNWPVTGPVWVRITPDGTAALGWRSKPYTGTAAKALRSEAAVAAAAFAAMQVDDTCTVPVGYHPRHGLRTETWLKVR